MTKEKLLQQCIKEEYGCWLWTGRTTKGYGVVSIKNHPTYVHRLSYELYKGEIPKGMFVCHSCDVKNCMNPEHLWLGTNQENVTDAVQKKLHSFGEDRPTAKLTDKDVLEIRESTLKMRKLAILYKVGLSTIWRAKNKVYWKHVNG